MYYVHDRILYVIHHIYNTIIILSNYLHTLFAEPLHRNILLLIIILNRISPQNPSNACTLNNEESRRLPRI